MNSYFHRILIYNSLIQLGEELHLFSSSSMKVSLSIGNIWCRDDDTNYGVTPSSIYPPPCEALQKGKDEFFFPHLPVHWFFLLFFSISSFLLIVFCPHHPFLPNCSINSVTSFAFCFAPSAILDQLFFFFFFKVRFTFLHLSRLSTVLFGMSLDRFEKTF